MSIIDKFLDKRAKGKNATAEMAFVDHIEALRWHLVRALVAVVIVTIIVYINIGWIFDHIILGPSKPDFITYKWLCQLGELTGIKEFCLSPQGIKFQSTQISGQFMMGFTSSFMIGFIAAFPYIFWEFWRFTKPALKENELKYAKGIVFWTSLLFFVGVSFAYFIIAPFTLSFFAEFQLSPQFENIITIDSYYDTVGDLVLGMGLVFELPILVYFLSRVGVLTPKLMRDNRRYAIVIILFLGAIITPPDMFSIFLVSIPLIMLYEAAIKVCARIIKNRDKDKDAQEQKQLDW